jgi:formate dehydrogenase major subunit
MNAPVSQELLAPASVKFKLNKQTVVGFEGESILNAAKRHGIEIPHLCYKEGMRADGNCRACVVEIQGERTLAPSAAETSRLDWKSCPTVCALSKTKKWCLNC